LATRLHEIAVAVCGGVDHFTLLETRPGHLRVSPLDKTRRHDRAFLGRFEVPIPSLSFQDRRDTFRRLPAPSASTAKHPGETSSGRLDTMISSEIIDIQLP
jgi:hypothetical protein